MRRSRASTAGWLGFCFLAAVYLAYVAVLSQKAIDRAVAGILPLSDNDSALPSSERTFGPLFLDEDSLMWLLHAENGLREDVCRIRTTRVDNTPFGRAVHWSSVPIWFLQLGATVVSRCYNIPLRESLSRTALWWNPVVHWILVSLTSWLILRRWDLKSALLAGATLAALPSLHFTLHTARPDHHGLQALFVALSLLLPVMAGLGWNVNQSDNDERRSNIGWRVRSRQWMILAGVAAGGGLWVGAVVQTVVLVGAGIGLCFWLWREHSIGSETAIFDPQLWRWWGWSGAASSFAFYLLEYFPSHMEMHLEVNHPWYALCLAAAGEVFCRLGRLAFRGGNWKNEGPIIGVGGAVLLSLPLGLWLGPIEWHALKDPWMQRMHDSILEFHPYAQVYAPFAWSHFWISFGFLPLLIGLAAHVSRSATVETSEKGGLFVLGFTSLLLLFCLSFQNRWTVFFGVTAVLLATSTARVHSRISTWSRALYVLLFAQALLWGWSNIATARAYGAQQNDPALAAAVAERRTAVEFAQIRGVDEWRVFCEPTDAPVFAYYTGSSALTSFYWENRLGLRDATLFMTDENDEEARKIARDRGLTHVILNNTAEPAKFYQHVRYGAIDLEKAKLSLAGRLARRQPPSWLRLNERMTEIAQRQYKGRDFVLNQKLLVYEIDHAALK